ARGLNADAFKSVSHELAWTSYLVDAGSGDNVVRGNRRYDTPTRGGKVLRHWLFFDPTLADQVSQIAHNLFAPQPVAGFQFGTKDTDRNRSTRVSSPYARCITISIVEKAQHNMAHFVIGEFRCNLLRPRHDFSFGGAVSCRVRARPSE